MSIQLFSANYKVVLKKGVTLSQQEVDNNKKKIEVATKKDFDLIMNATMQGANFMISGMMNGQMPLSSSDKNLEKYTETMITDLFSSQDHPSKGSSYSFTLNLSIAISCFSCSAIYFLLLLHLSLLYSNKYPSEQKCLFPNLYFTFSVLTIYNFSSILRCKYYMIFTRPFSMRQAISFISHINTFLSLIAA